MTGRSRWRPSAAGRLAILLVALGVAGLGTASSASAADCVSGSTGWSATPVDSDFTNSANWSNGSPSADCDAVVTAGGTYTVSLSSGVTVKSLTIGGGTGVQTLNISAVSSNTKLTATNGVTVGLHGAIRLDCPPGGCTGGSGGAPKIDVGASTLTNAGTITVTPLASGAGGFAGNVTNTGRIQANGNAVHTGSTGPSATLLNQGTLALANGVTLESSGASCGDTTVAVVNGAGGQISSAGSGTLNAATYNQGAGTTTGTAPVTMSCGTLTYTGSGASTVLVLASGGITLAGDIAAGQTLRIEGFVITDAVSNAGTITFDQSTSSPVLTTGGQTLTNTGTIATAGASPETAAFTGGGTIDQTGATGVISVAAGTTFNPGTQELLLHAGRLAGSGTISGSVHNAGGTVAAGAASPGTLTVSGSYVQGAAGTLESAVEGTGAGAASKLAVGGAVALQGTLRLVPGAAYAASAGLGDSVTVLTYTDLIGGGFATTTTAAPLAGGRVFAAAHDGQAKHVNAVVVPGPPVVAGPVPASPAPAPAPTPDTSAPSLTGVRLALSRFRATAGTTLTLNASRASALTVVISQARRGRRVGKRCVLKARKGKACTVTVKQATLKLTAVQGANRLAFRAPKLKPGSYTAVVTALATSGPASKPVKLSFTITKAKKKKPKRK